MDTHGTENNETNTIRRYKYTELISFTYEMSVCGQSIDR